MDIFLLLLGFGLGLLLCALLIFKILPPLDHVVKKERGPFEACCLTRCCPLVIALPFYVFTVWMLVVVLFKDDKAIAVLNEICPNEYGCSNVFALGRAQFDKDACTSPNCTDSELQARSGQKPLDFPRLGLGEEMEPSIGLIKYECIEEVDGTCAIAKSDDIICSCEAGLQKNSSPLFCSRTQGCLNDIDKNKRTSECSNEDCTEWIVTSDSAKQFSFENCSCVTEDCVDFNCNFFVMKYFYPNVFLAGGLSILFILPITIVVYIVLKTHLRKIFPCGGYQLFVFNQEAGAQNEFSADNLATGGFNEEQTQRTKYRPFGVQDLLALILGPILIGFFCWVVVSVSGRVGLSFICVVFVLIFLVEVYGFYKMRKKQNEDIKRRVKNNNGNPLRAEF